MIKSISFENYRSFTNPTKIDVKPITIFVGPNSSGKSSIMKLFALLAQSYLNGGDQLLTYRGPLVVFDDFQSIKGRGDGKHLRIGFELSDEITDPYRQTELGIGGLQGSFAANSAVANLIGLSDLFDWGQNLTIEGEIILRGHAFKSATEAQTQLIQHERMEIMKRGPLEDKLVFSSKLALHDRSLDLFARLNTTEYANIEDETKILFKEGLGDLFVVKEDVEWNEKKIEAYMRRFLIRIGAIRVQHRGLQLGELYNSDDQFNGPHSSPPQLSHDNPFRKTLYGDGLGVIERYTTRHLPELQEQLKKLLKEFAESTHSVDGEHLNEVCDHFVHNRIHHLIRGKRQQADRLLREVVNPLLKKTFSYINLLRPLREAPSDIYSHEELWYKILQGRANLPNLSKFDKVNDLIERVSQRLLELGNPYTLNIERLDSNGKPTSLFRVLLKDQQTGETRNISDVGFGISQVLPIVTASENNRDIEDCDPLILIEQPELHLHPMMQARLASVLNHGLYKIGSDPGSSGKRSATTFIAETHSEHFVRAFQVLVAKGLLDPADLAIYYVRKDEEGNSYVDRFDVDDKGFFTRPWPEGFFDQAYLQSLELIAGKN
jgi:energy-coupling factor transporter ATP-binding protein EcfA2